MPKKVMARRGWPYVLATAGLGAALVSFFPLTGAPVPVTVAVGSMVAVIVVAHLLGTGERRGPFVLDAPVSSRGVVVWGSLAGSWIGFWATLWVSSTVAGVDIPSGMAVGMVGVGVLLVVRQLWLSRTRQADHSRRRHS